jgi:D-glycero-D-manno-heptose 1,7-bisphosphate phosphatase
VQPAVFLDRDNTLISNDGDLGDPEEVRLLDGVAIGLKALREAGFNLVVVTNQAGVARGKFTEDDVDSVHQRIAMLVDAQAAHPGAGVIDRFYYCPYHPEATVPEYRRDHPWRKPHPGMILQAARDMGLDLSRSWMIGDQERDIAAGQAAGCRTVLVTRDAGLAERLQPTEVAATFVQAVQLIERQGQLGARAERIGQSNGLPSARPASVPTRPEGESAGETAGSADLAGIRRAVQDLAEEIRADRLRRAEFTSLRMAAGVCQLLALLLAMLGLLQLGNPDAFMKWMIGAGLAQLLTITLLLLDLKS